VPFKSTNAAINPTVNETAVRPSSKSIAPDWSSTKRQIKFFIAQAHPDEKVRIRFDHLQNPVVSGLNQPFKTAPDFKQMRPIPHPRPLAMQLAASATAAV
jgi:hypothetical protein